MRDQTASGADVTLAAVPSPAGDGRSSEEPLVSIVVPVHDGATTLGATLASVLAQSLSDLEVIVVDDGSTDASAAVARGTSDDRVRVLETRRGGVAAARNHGARQARAPYLAFCDADDLWTPAKLVRQVAALEADPDAHVAYSWTLYVDEQDRLIAAGPRWRTQGEVLDVLLQRDVLESGSNGLVRRTAFLDSGGFDERLTGAADWDLFLRLAQRGRFAVVPSFDVRYRLRAGSMSSDVAPQADEYRRMLDAAFARADPAMGRLRPRTDAGVHLFLAARALEPPVGAHRALAGLLQLSGAVRSSRSVCWSERRLVAVLLLKALAAVVVPAPLTIRLLDRLRAHRGPAHTGWP